MAGKKWNEIVLHARKEYSPRINRYKLYLGYTTFLEVEVGSRRKREDPAESIDGNWTRWQVGREKGRGFVRHGDNKFDNKV